MNILVVNDDGITAKGLSILVKAASYFGTVYVTAPIEGQSGKSAAITIRGKMNIEEETPIIGSVRTIKVDGTPADCLRAGLKLFEVEFDLILAGINHGPNLASDVHYSGTVAVGFESYIHGVPAVAFSADDINEPYIYDETVKLLDEIIEYKLYMGTAMLNVNFPNRNFKKSLGTKITKMGLRTQFIEHIKSETPNLYHLSHSIINYKEDEDSDITAFNNGYVSITPLQFDRTDYKKIEAILNDKK